MNSFAQPWEEVSLLGHCIYAKIENCTAAMQILVKWCKKQILESINTKGGVFFGCKVKSDVLPSAFQLSFLIKSISLLATTAAAAETALIA